MAVTLDIAETNGPLASSVETLDISNLNFGSGDVAELTPSSYPITAQAGGHSYEKWIRIHISAMGGSTQLDNLKVWLSALGGGWKTGEGLSTNMRESGYSAASYNAAGPVEINSPDADQVMPETEPTGPNLGIGGSLAGQITSAPAYSDWAVLQLDVSELTPAGSLNTKTLTLQWDEM